MAERKRKASEYVALGDLSFADPDGPSYDVASGEFLPAETSDEILEGFIESGAVAHRSEFELHGPDDDA